MKCRLHDPFEKVAYRCGGEVKLSVGGVAGPSRRRRSYGGIDVSGLPSGSVAGMLAVLVKYLESWFARGCARALAGLFSLRTRSLPNQAPEPTPTSVTDRACARSAPDAGAAQL